jgi:hypothetical protein
MIAGDPCSVLADRTESLSVMNRAKVQAARMLKHAGSLSWLSGLNGYSECVVGSIRIGPAKSGRAGG